jgi:hypothetical protein
MEKHNNSSKDRTPSPGIEKSTDDHAHHFDHANALDMFADPDAGKSDEERARIVRSTAAMILSISHAEKRAGQEPRPPPRHEDHTCKSPANRQRKLDSQRGHNSLDFSG